MSRVVVFALVQLVFETILVIKGLGTSMAPEPQSMALVSVQLWVDDRKGLRAGMAQEPHSICFVTIQIVVEVLFTIPET